MQALGGDIHEYIAQNLAEAGKQHVEVSVASGSAMKCEALRRVAGVSEPRECGVVVARSIRI